MNKVKNVLAKKARTKDADKRYLQRAADLAAGRIKVYDVFVNFNDRYDVNVIVVAQTARAARRTAIDAARDEAGNEEGKVTDCHVAVVTVATVMELAFDYSREGSLDFLQSIRDAMMSVDGAEAYSSGT